MSEAAKEPVSRHRKIIVQEWSEKGMRTQIQLWDRNPSGEKSAQIGTIPHSPRTELILSYLVGKGAEGFKMTLIDSCLFLIVSSGVLLIGVVVVEWYYLAQVWRCFALVGESSDRCGCGTNRDKFSQQIMFVGPNYDTIDFFFQI